MTPAFVRSLLVLVPACALAASAAAQAPASEPVPPGRSRAQAADSARALRAARGAQAGFESLRFRHLPWTWDNGTPPCDERIGRFCIWHDESEDDWTPPPEPDAVKRGRERLVESLATAARAIPGDAWVAGQRVRYLVEAGRTDDAVAAAGECRARRWWCRALEGYALHAAERYGAADSAFTAALAAMPAREAREWDDLSPILTDRDARDLRRMQPDARARAVRRLWWLADPLWMEPGNDRRTEHYARLVTDRLQDRTQIVESIPWGDDLREILLRYGQPTGWEKVRERPGQMGRPSVITHYSSTAREYLPPLSRADDPTTLEPADWEREGIEARTAYAPRYAGKVHPLEHQVAVFRRGDSAVVVAAYRLDPDSLPPAPRISAGLVVAVDEGVPPRVETSPGMGITGALRVSAAPAPSVLSLEVREDSSLRVGRARYGLRLEPRAGGVELSDVLLLADPDARPASLDDALTVARGHTAARPGERLGLYWEVYGLEERADSLTVSVTLVRRRAGWGRRMAERVGVAGAPAPVRMRWTEEAGGEGVVARSLGIALPQVAPGEYLLQVTVQPRGGRAVTTTRAVTVERPATPPARR